jgi:hypothetical protein
MAFCRIRNLIPGKHIVFSLRQSNEWDETVNAKVKTTKIVFMTTIDAARLIALRSGEYAGQAPEVYIYLDEHGSPSIESTIPLPQLPLISGQTALPREPWAVRTTVYRKDFDYPMSSVARFDAYAATYKGANGPQLTEMWSRRPGEMLAKCSEMLSLRKAFPEELGSLYIAEEFKAEAEENRPTAVTPASVAPLPPVAPKVDQTPAEPTNAPRPGESPKVEYHVTSVPATLPKHSGSVLVVKEAETTTHLTEEGEAVVVTTKPKTEAVEAAKKAVPDLKPASEIPTPKKRGPKPKNRPDNGQNVDGITQADIDNVEQNPAPVIDEAAEKAEATAFVDSVVNMTAEEASAQGLPEPPEYSLIPNKEQREGFVARTRLIPEPGVDIKTVGDYMLRVSNKVGQASNKLTVGDWTKALGLLEAAKKAGTLKELVKEVKDEPLAEF